jgi:hypothetical protein
MQPARGSFAPFVLRGLIGRYRPRRHDACATNRRAAVHFATGHGVRGGLDCHAVHQHNDLKGLANSAHGAGSRFIESDQIDPSPRTVYRPELHVAETPCISGRHQALKLASRDGNRTSRSKRWRFIRVRPERRPFEIASQDSEVPSLTEYIARPLASHICTSHLQRDQQAERHTFLRQTRFLRRLRRCDHFCRPWKTATISDGVAAESILNQIRGAWHAHLARAGDSPGPPQVAQGREMFHHAGDRGRLPAGALRNRRAFAPSCHRDCEIWIQ